MYLFTGGNDYIFGLILFTSSPFHPNFLQSCFSLNVATIESSTIASIYHYLAHNELDLGEFSIHKNSHAFAVYTE